ncbi:glycosyltransferase [Candidatus Sumerlaeota bacterium]|nr:glycosyltransferase [Candidatus Sumerlaeota bacterium]
MNSVVSIVLGSFNRRRYLRATLDNVRSHDVGAPYEIVVVDGGSTDGSLRYLSRQKDVITIVQHNRGVWRGQPIERRSWGYFMNLGFRAAQGTYVCMISDDALLVPGAIRNGIEFFEARRAEGRNVGSVAFYWRNWPSPDRYFVSKAYGTTFVNHGLFMKEALENVGYIDEEAFRFYCADADLCLRMRDKGYECLECEDAHVEHHSHANRAARESNKTLMDNDRAAFLARWSHLDPKLREYERVQTLHFHDFRDAARTADVFRRIDRWNLTERLLPLKYRLGGILQVRTRLGKIKRSISGQSPGQDR